MVSGWQTCKALLVVVAFVSVSSEPLEVLEDRFVNVAHQIGELVESYLLDLEIEQFMNE